MGGMGAGGTGLWAVWAGLPFARPAPNTASLCARVLAVKCLCCLCFSQRRGPSSGLGGEWSRCGERVSGWEGVVSRAIMAGPSDSEATNLPEWGDLGWGRQMDPPRCCHLGSYVGSQERVWPRFWPELLAVCPRDPTLGTPCFRCCPAVCPPVCLPPVSLPRQPLLFLQHPISILSAPQPSVTPKGTALKALPCSVPVPSLPLAQGPRPGPILLWEPRPGPSSGSGPSFTTFLLSYPSPRAPACSGREASRTLFPLFKVSRLVSQEGGLSPPSCLPLLPSQMPHSSLEGRKWGRGLSLVAPGLCQGRGAAET